MEFKLIMQQVINGLSLGAIYSLIAVGFAMIFNVLKFSNFAHGGTLGFSAYAGFLAATRLGLPLFPVILIGMATGGVVAMLVELVAFRWIRMQKGQLVYFFVTSITMMLLLEQILIMIFGFGASDAFFPLLDALFIGSAFLACASVPFLLVSIVVGIVVSFRAKQQAGWDIPVITYVISSILFVAWLAFSVFSLF